MGKLADEPEETFPYEYIFRVQAPKPQPRRIADAFPYTRQRQEFRVFNELLKMVPGLEERLMDAQSDKDVAIIAELVRESNSQLKI